MRYKTSTRAATFIKIGFALSTLTEWRMMNIAPRVKYEGTITPEEVSASLSHIDDLPFNTSPDESN